MKNKIEVFAVGLRVKHPEFGEGTVIAVEKDSKSGILSDRHHRTQVNIGVKFDTGGPQGWAEVAGKRVWPRNHNLAELEAV